MPHPLFSSLAVVLVSHVVVSGAVLALVATMMRDEVTAAPDLETSFRACAPGPPTRSAAPTSGASQFGAHVSGARPRRPPLDGSRPGVELRDVVAANQDGRIDPAGTPRALELERRMATPAPSVLPAPGVAAAIAAAEAATRGAPARRRCDASIPRSPTAASGRARGCCPCPRSSPPTATCGRPGRAPGPDLAGRPHPTRVEWTRAGTASRRRPGGSSPGTRRTSPSTRARTGSGARSARSSRRSRRG